MTAVRPATFLRKHTAAACVLVAFALRLWLVMGVESVVSPDGVVYAGLARQLAAGHLRAGLDDFFPPLYPLLIALASFVFRDVEFAGRFVSVAAGALTVVPVYALAREWYGARVARLAAVVVALHPLLIYYSSVLLTESTYTLLFTCGVLVGWRALGQLGRTRAYFLTGAIFGACYLLKPEATGFILLLLALRVGAHFFGARRSAGRTLLDCAALASSFALLALPYIAFLHSVTGVWMLSMKLRPHLLQGSGRVGEFVSATPVPGFVAVLTQTAKGLMNEYNFLGMIFSPPFVALVALGLCRASWTRARLRRELYLAVFVAATLAGYAVTLPNIRFLIPLLPLLICWLARGIAEFEDWFAATLRRARADEVDERDASRHETEGRAAEEFAAREAASAKAVAPGLSPRGSRLVVACVVVLLLTSLVPLFVFLLRGDKWGDYHGQKVAAVWIKEHAATSAPRIMATAPIAAFYAGGEDILLAGDSVTAVVERARRERADFIIANERSLSGTSLRALLDAQAEHPGLRLVHEVREAPGHKMLVYVLENP
jgi:hypothetical protein